MESLHHVTFCAPCRSDESPLRIRTYPARRFIEPPSIRGYLGQLYAITGWTSLPWLHTLRQPTLVLNGDDDPIVPPINGRILAHCIPDARLYVWHYDSSRTPTVTVPCWRPGVRPSTVWR